jgi:hypothetical protein
MSVFKRSGEDPLERNLLAGLCAVESGCSGAVIRIDTVRKHFAVAIYYRDDFI